MDSEADYDWDFYNLNEWGKTLIEVKFFGKTNKPIDAEKIAYKYWRVVIKEME